MLFSSTGMLIPEALCTDSRNSFMQFMNLMFELVSAQKRFVSPLFEFSTSSANSVWKAWISLLDERLLEDEAQDAIADFGAAAVVVAFEDLVD
jgi:hypothetical protein